MAKLSRKQKTKQVKEQKSSWDSNTVRIAFVVLSTIYFIFSANNFYKNYINHDKNEDKIISEDPSYYIEQTFELIRNNTVKLTMKSRHLRLVINRAVRICNNRSYDEYVTGESLKHYDQYVNGVDRLFVLNEDVDETKLIANMIHLLANMFKVAKLGERQCRPEKLLNWASQTKKSNVLKSIQDFAEVHVNTSSSCSDKLFEKLTEMEKSIKNRDKVLDIMKNVIIKYQKNLTETQKTLIKSIEYYKGSLDDLL